MQRKCAQMTQRKLLEQLFGYVTEDDLYFHNTHSSRYTYDENNNMIKHTTLWGENDMNPDEEKYEYLFVYIPFDLTKEEINELFLDCLSPMGN
jgi:hypothetical protein